MALDAIALEKQLDAIDSTSFSSDEDRCRLQYAALRLFRKIEFPIETAKRIAAADVGIYAVFKIGIDIGLFEALAADNGSVKTQDELAKACKIDAEFMGRILRHLASNFYLRHVSREEFAPTEFTLAMTQPGLVGCMNARWDSAVPTIAKMPQYFKEHGYKSPKDGAIFKYGQDTELDFFPWIAARPQTFSAFNDFMAGYAISRPSFVEFYPFKERIIEGFDKSTSDVLIVDLGGNKGHDMLKLKSRIPEVPGRVIVQDLPNVMEQADTDGGKFEKLPHDFFTDNPVKDARAYMFHSVLHDWPDAEAVKILTTLRPSLKKGYSRLLIQDVILPDTGINPESTDADWFMMYLVGAKERTLERWTDILEQAGYKINDRYKTMVDPQSVLEAEVA